MSNVAPCLRTDFQHSLPRARCIRKTTYLWEVSSPTRVIIQIRANQCHLSNYNNKNNQNSTFVPKEKCQWQFSTSSKMVSPPGSVTCTMRYHRIEHKFITISSSSTMTSHQCNRCEFKPSPCQLPLQAYVGRFVSNLQIVDGFYPVSSNQNAGRRFVSEKVLNTSKKLTPIK